VCIERGAQVPVLAAQACVLRTRPIQLISELIVFRANVALLLDACRDHASSFAGLPAACIRAPHQPGNG
jgi:hypothetical protein